METSKFDSFPLPVVESSGMGDVATKNATYFASLVEVNKK
jgi:hypothetical protein